MNYENRNSRLRSYRQRICSYLRMGSADDIWLIDLNKAHMDAVRDHGMTMTDHNGVHHLTRLPHRIQRTGSRPV